MGVVSCKISFSRTWLAVPDNFLESIGQAGAIGWIAFLPPPPRQPSFLEEMTNSGLYNTLCPGSIFGELHDYSQLAFEVEDLASPARGTQACPLELPANLAGRGEDADPCLFPAGAEHSSVEPRPPSSCLSPWSLAV